MQFDPHSSPTGEQAHPDPEVSIARIGDLLAGHAVAVPLVLECFDSLITCVRTDHLSRATNVVQRLQSLDFSLHPALGVRSLLIQAQYKYRVGDYRAMAEMATAARAQARALNSEELVFRSCIVAASAQLRMGLYVEARELYEEAIIAARRLDDKLAEGSAHLNLALLLNSQGDIRGAEQLCARAVACLRGSNRDRSLVTALINHGVMLTKLTHWESARALLQEAKELADAAGMHEYGTSAALGLARVFRLMGHSDESRSLLVRVLDSNASTLSPRTVTIANEYLGDLELDKGNVASAAFHYERAIEIARQLDVEGDLYVESLRRLADAKGTFPESLTEALRLAQTSVDLARSHKDSYELAHGLQVLGRLHLAANELPTAAAHLAESLSIWSDLGDRYEHGRTALLLSQVKSEQSDDLEAIALAIEARNELNAAWRTPWSAKADDWLSQLSTTLATAAPRTHRVDVRSTVQNARLPDGFVTVDSPLLRSVATLAKLAPRNLNILVLGETGTGKELIAKAIHDWSERKGPFVPVNCSAIPSELIEGELFGHSRGAYTGADRDRNGLIEYSHRGTLFLDEIGDMPVRAQARLLRALESGEIRRLGENSPRIVDLRVVAATHRNLLEMVSAGQFRLDLYYRLSGYVVEIPAVREREGDAALLIDHYLEEFCRAQDKPIQLAPDLRQELVSYSWPGNVREIKQVMHRLVSLAEPGQIMRRLPFELDGTPRPNSLPQALEAEEKKRVLDALHTHNWNKAKASVALGTSRTTLIGKMKRLGIPLRADSSST
ncbi:MAG: sigma 54-interacting transcriptional regulator [Candidatus Eiseniibacteriota bacterium]